jgi:hypothetical protein
MAVPHPSGDGTAIGAFGPDWLCPFEFGDSENFDQTLAIPDWIYYLRYVIRMMQRRDRRWFWQAAARVMATTWPEIEAAVWIWDSSDNHAHSRRSAWQSSGESRESAC